jgi:ProP effector
MSRRREQWRKDANAGIAKLVARFPECFHPLGYKRRPLKIGINADVVAAMAGEMTPVEVGAALRRYVSAIGYQRKLVAGAIRVDLQGREAGIVIESEEAAAWDARRRFVERSEERKLRAAKLKARAEVERRVRAFDDLRRSAQERKRRELPSREGR